MKKFSKVFALVLAFAMLMSTTAFAATLAEGNNGYTVDLSVRLTTDSAGEELVGDSVDAEGNFYVWIDFAGNPVEAMEDDEASGISAYNLYLAVDTTKIKVGTKTNQMTSCAWNKTFADNIIWFGYTSTDPLCDDEGEYAAAGSFVRVKLTANEALTKEDLAAIQLVSTVEGEEPAYVMDNKVPATYFTVTVPDVEEEVDPTVYGNAIACEKTWTAAKNANTTNTNTYTNVAVATAEYAAGATEAGFKFAKDSEVASATAAKFPVLDAAAIAGSGSVEYTAVMFGVDYNEVDTIYAIPYYVPAAN